MDTGIQVEVWNILKYALLTLLLAPVAEAVMSETTARRNAQLVNKGKLIRLKSSAWGNIALHQEVECNHLSSRFWQLFSVLLALAIAVPFEYSSGAQSQLVWSEEASRSSALSGNGTEDHILLGLDNVVDLSECINPNSLAAVGEFVYLQPTEDKPQLLNGVVTLENMNELLAVKYQGQNWQRRELKSRKGDTGLVLLAGGRGGQQAIIGDFSRGGQFVADFETGSLCKGLLNESFSCYELGGKFTVSDLVYSLAAIRGSSIFLRTRFQMEAKLFMFNPQLISLSIGDPSVKANLFEQRLNESGFEWLLRHKEDGGSPSLSITTLTLDERIRSVSCEAIGSVKIRPLKLRVGDNLEGERLDMNLSANGDLKVVKVGKRLQTKLLTESSAGWKCSVDTKSGVCLSKTNGTLYFLSKAEATFTYTTEFELRVTQSPETDAELVVLHTQIVNEILREGSVASWDVRKLLSFPVEPLEGARTISTRVDTAVPISSGIHVTGTIKVWALWLYGGFALLFVLILVYFRLKPRPRIDIERMYRRVVMEKDAPVDTSMTLNTPPTIRIGTAHEDGVAGLTASYSMLGTPKDQREVQRGERGAQEEPS